MRSRAALILLVSLLGTAGCAYYNTFYLAKKYYAQAERLANAGGSDKLPPEAQRKYEESIRQSGKVLKYHPDSRWVDDALYLMGAALYGKRDYEEALRKFDELVAGHPDSRFVPLALYQSGLCHYQRRAYEQMDGYFRRVLEGYPKFERRDDILYTQGMAADQRRERTEAIRRYSELVTEYPRSRRAQDALLRIGDLYFDAGSVDSALASYDQLARLSSEEETWRTARIKSADALVRSGRPDEAVDRLDELLPQDDPTQARQGDNGPPQVYLALARAHNAAGRHDRALASLRTVTDKYRASSFTAEAQFQIGYTYEAYLDSVDAARRAYDEVGRLGGTSVFRDQATTRSRNLVQLQNLSTQARDDSTSGDESSADALLRIAELQLFSQSRLPEAAASYRRVIAEYPQSRSAPRAAYALAWIQLRREEGKRDSALARLAELVHLYPSSPVARGAIDLLAAEGADTTGLAAQLVEPAPEPLPEPAPEAAPTSGAAGPTSPAGAPAPSSPSSPLTPGEPDSLGPPSREATFDSTGRAGIAPVSPEAPPGAPADSILTVESADSARSTPPTPDPPPREP